MLGQLQFSVQNENLSCIVLQGTQEEWRTVFFLSGGLLLFSGLVYVILAEDGIAEWAKDKENSEQKHDTVNKQTTTAENSESESVSGTEAKDVQVWF